MSRQQMQLRRVVAGAVLLALGVGVAAVLPGCSNGAGDTAWPDRKGPKVVVSFAPLYCFAANVAGDDAVVQNLLTTSGPHHFNPTDKDARLLRHADIFFVNGLELEGDKPSTMKRGSGNANLKIVELGAKIPADQLCEGSCNHEEEGHDHKHEHGTDPHVWLSPDYAILMVNAIRDELKAADPDHAANYDRRAAEYCDKLRKLKEDGAALLRDKKDRQVVTFHDSMAYFAKTFDLKVVGVVQKKPGSEPNDSQLTKLVALCASPPPVRIICVEPQYGNSNAGTALIRSLEFKGVKDAQLVEFDTLETVPPKELTPDWYEKKMRANLAALAEKMK